MTNIGTISQDQICTVSNILLIRGSHHKLDTTKQKKIYLDYHTMG
jgi:hypothetical protein